MIEDLIKQTVENTVRECLEQILKEINHRTENMTAEETANYLKISYSKLMKQKDNLGIPYKNIGNQLLFIKSEVDNWLSNQ